MAFKMMENKTVVNMILAGDVGGTKTLLGVFDTAPARPAPISVRAFRTSDYPDLSSVLSVFLEECVQGGGITAACFGIAGPVVGRRAELTNAPFQIDADRVGRQIADRPVLLLNDLQAMAHGVPVLDASELHALQEGTPQLDGNMAVIAAGTGLGESILHNVDGRLLPVPSEAGHADWAARNEEEIEVLRALLRRFDRVEVERVVSGSGLVNVYGVTHERVQHCPAIADGSPAPTPAAVSTTALEGRCPGCIAALDIFVKAYGAEAGNLALRAVSTGGVFIGGGIAPKILPALIDGRFLEAFRDKGVYRALVERMPVNVILNDDVGLLGAAVAARHLVAPQAALR